jgi:dTDP-4-dehydrorhamnose 3,5-epimerase
LCENPFLKFSDTQVADAHVVDLARVEDERGYFARVWCREAFAAQGLPTDLAQVSMSFNRRKGTLRGMHLQSAPHEEAKLVRCARGAIFDVVLDLRPSSPTFLRWDAVELSASNGRMLFLPYGCAHGFQTLEDDCEVVYHISNFYHPESARGYRWDDPAFAISWPLPVSVMSAADKTYPDFPA